MDLLLDSPSTTGVSFTKDFGSLQRSPTSLAIVTVSRLWPPHTAVFAKYSPSISTRGGSGLLYTTWGFLAITSVPYYHPKL